jgi:hypothetical protein
VLRVRTAGMARKLKTYQTSIGFYDLAVAAPSMKAALNAWGSVRTAKLEASVRKLDEVHRKSIADIERARAALVKRSKWNASVGKSRKRGLRRGCVGCVSSPAFAAFSCSREVPVSH